jgi:LuxR family maltose regulon positive regulatory protein
VDRVRAAADGPLVTIVAGAGWGKSLLLTLAATQTGDSMWAWLSVDQGMRSPILLMTYMMASVAERVPGFGAGVQLAGPPEAQAGAFLAECEQVVAEDIVICLDDVHALSGSPSERALAAVVSGLPPRAHVALASRTELDVPLGRLRTAGQVTELAERDLALDAAEAAALLRSQGTIVSDEQAAALQRRTEGWPAGIALLAQAGLEAVPPHALDRSHLFAYLAEEVYERQPPRLRDFLLATSVPERFDASLARALSGRADAARLIAELRRARLFCERLPGPGSWHRYHQLFRQFLLERLEERSGGRRQALERLAGETWLAKGERTEAVVHLLAAGEAARALDAVEPVAEQMATSAQADQLAGWLARIPRERWGERPALVLAEATLSFGRGEFDRAIDALERAITRFVEQGESERAALGSCFLMNALASTTSGQQERAIASGRQFLALLDPGRPLVGAGRVMLAAINGYAGHYAAAEAELDRALAAIPVPPPWLRAYAECVRAFWIDFPAGRLEAASGALGAALPQIDGGPDDDPLAFAPVLYSWLCWVMMQRGDADSALDALERAEAAGRRRGIAGGMAEMSKWRATVLAIAERWTDLSLELARFPAGGAGQQSYHLDIAEARLLAHDGGPPGTLEAAVERARAGVRRTACTFEEAMVLCELATAAQDAGVADLARPLGASALAVARRGGEPWSLARAHLTSALADGPDADDDLDAALTLTAADVSDELWTRKERRRAAPLLARALARGLGPDGVAERLLAASGGEVISECAAQLEDAPPAARAALARAAGQVSDADAALLARLARDPDAAVREAGRAAQVALAGRPRPPLRIATLGGLRVHHGEHPVTERSFGRRKARALLACLICARGPVHRERLAEWLWPELPSARALPAFHTALYELRRALEPGLTRGVASRLVVTDGESYRLALSPHDELDAEALLRLARRPEAPEAPDAEIRRLERARALWGGEFLPEWPYADWARDLRRLLDAAYEDVLQDLGEALLAAGRPREAAGPFRALLLRDPEREAACRGAMRAHAAAGEPALALRQFHLLRAALRRGQGTEPTEETRALFSRILRTGL